MGTYIVLNVSRVATFDVVVKWKNDLDTKVQLPDGSPIPCILLVNKGTYLKALSSGVFDSIYQHLVLKIKKKHLI